MSKWISVEDRLPEVRFRWYLIATKDGDGNKITTLAFFESRDIKGEHEDIMWLCHNDKSSGYSEWDDVTHWMPLPEPPNNT